MSGVEEIVTCFEDCPDANIEQKIQTIYSLALEEHCKPEKIGAELSKYHSKKDICFALFGLDYSIDEVSYIAGVNSGKAWAYSVLYKGVKGKRRYAPRELTEQEKKEIYEELTKMAKEGKAAEIRNGKVVKMSFVIADKYKVPVDSIKGIMAAWSKENKELYKKKEDTYKKMKKESIILRRKK